LISSLLLDFLFNTLFYSDEIVSRKYHNDGNLDFIITFALSIISNIVSAIFMHFIESTQILEERIELIKEIKNEYKYLYSLSKYLKLIKLRMVSFIISEILILGISFYYLVIFFIVYSRSRKSLLINFLTSLLEGFIKSIIITVVILITRIIGISCRNPYIYNTSKFIDEKF